MTVQEIITSITTKKKETGGINSVYFIACGGSLTAFYPAKYFLDSEAKKLRVGYYTSNEFVHVTPKALNKNSVAVLTSHRGNTPETIQAAKLCQELGVTTIVLTYRVDSPITPYADYMIQYEWGDGSKVENQKTAMGLKIAVELLNQVEGYGHYNEFGDGFAKIDGIVESASGHVKQSADKFADEYKDEKIIYTMSSGSGYGAAHQQAICIFMEMQWINSSSIHSGEYFHGPFEITDKVTSFILLMNEGRTRELDERALTFLKKYGEKVIVIDAKELGINVIDDSVVEFFNPFLLTGALAVYNDALATVRKHPLTHRRYMWKVKY